MGFENIKWINIYTLRLVGVNLSSILYIDAILFANSDSVIVWDQTMLSKIFYIKNLKEALFILGFEIHRNSLWCIKNILKSTYWSYTKFSMHTFKLRGVYMVKGDKFSRNQYLKNNVEKISWGMYLIQLLCVVSWMQKFMPNRI